MRLKKIYTSLLTAFLSSLVVLSTSGTAFATSVNYNNLLSDVVLDNYNSMNVAQINTFLNSFSGSCISTNHGFQAPDPTGYNPTNGFLYGSNVSAGQVFYDAAQAYQINPQVLLATMQKEQSIVTGAAGCSTLAYAAAMGYGCPDGGTTYSYNGVDLYTLNGSEVTSVSGTCVNSSAKVGFSQQVIHAAWLLKFDRERAEGNVSWAIINGNWDNSDDPNTCYYGYMVPGTWAQCPSGAAASFDGLYTIDNTSVTMGQGATAALYDYTPHLSGNSNFVNIFTAWFGATVTSNTPYAWQASALLTYQDSAHTIGFTNGIYVQPGQTAYIEVQAENNGYETWSTADAHLGLYDPSNGTPLSNSSWYSSNRIAMANTSSVFPGQTATYDFSVTAPQTPGDYTLKLGLIQDCAVAMCGWMTGPIVPFTINVVSTAATTSNATTLTPGQSLYPGQYILSPDGQSMLIMQGDGNVVLYSDFKPIWSTNTPGTNPGKLILQDDGNLVLYNSSGSPLWATGTNGDPVEDLSLQTDGNLVLYNTSSQNLWNTGILSVPVHTDSVNYLLPDGEAMWRGQSLSTDARNCTLILQDDGNLVLYNSSGSPLWATGTNGLPVAFAVMQGDGNFVLYSAAGKPLWASNTDRRGGAFALLQDDGNFVVYTGSGAPLWATNTSGL